VEDARASLKMVSDRRCMAEVNWEKQIERDSCPTSAEIVVKKDLSRES